MKIILSLLLVLTMYSPGLGEEHSIIPAKDDLICYFACDDEDAGNAVDSAESGVKAIYSGDSPSLVRGPFGKALRCFGAGDEDVFRYGLNLGKHDFTIAFWVHVARYSGVDFRGEKKKGLVVLGYNPLLFIFLDDSGRITLEMPAADNASMSADTVPPTDRWTHLAFVVDRDSDTGCGIYLNGKKQPMALVNMTPTANYEYNMDTGFMFGRALVGDLDELAVYGKALTEGEVKAMCPDIPEGTTRWLESPVTEADTFPPERKPYRLKQARRNAAQKQRRIIYNDDGVYVRPFETPQKFYRARQQQILDTQVDTVFFNVGATTIFTFDNDVGEIYGEFINMKSPAWAQNVKRGIEGLRKTSDSTAGLALEYCHANDLEFFLSLRMNDIHDSFLPFMRSRFKREHPHYLFGPKSLNYEYPEVRDYIYRILESFCTNFNIDGIELDWWRGPRAFPPSWEGKPLELRHVEMMNNLIRRIRIMTERVGEERGRPILLAARTPMSVEHSLFLGFDLMTWFEEDLLDVLIIGGGYAPMAVVSSVREIADTAHQYGVPVYATISSSGMMSGRPYGSGHESVEAWRGAAMNIWHAGADGIYTFNFCPPERDERFDQLGAPETLKGLDKIYSIDRMIIEAFPPKGRWALVAPDRLPITLEKKGWTQAKLPVGENITANTPAGKTCTARLRLKFTALAEKDRVAVRLNGHELGSAAREPMGWMAWEPDPSLVHKGYNLVEVKLSSQQDVAEMPAIDRLNLTVRY